MAEILLSGGTGLLGSRLLVDLARGNNVTALARNPPTTVTPGVRWVAHDLASPVLPDDLPRVDAVIHLAQSRQFRDFPDQARDIFAVNTASTALLLDWARTSGARRFIVASTGAVYAGGHAPLQEDAPLSVPSLRSFYAASKMASEAIAFGYRSEMNISILRFFFIYGPDQDRAMLMPRIVSSVAAGQPIRLQGRDGIRMNPIYVADAVLAVLGCLSLPDSAILNVAGPETISLRKIAELVGDHLGVRPRFDISDDLPPADLIADISAMAARLGSPTTTFASVVPELCRPS